MEKDDIEIESISETAVSEKSDEDENSLMAIEEEEEVLPTFGRSKSLFHSLRNKRKAPADYVAEEALYSVSTFLAVRSDEATTGKYILCKLLKDVTTTTKRFPIMWLQSTPNVDFYIEGYNDEISATTVIDFVTLSNEAECKYSLPSDQKKKILKKIKEEEDEENIEISITQIINDKKREKPKVHSIQKKIEEVEVEEEIEKPKKVPRTRKSKPAAEKESETSPKKGRGRGRKRKVEEVTTGETSPTPAVKKRKIHRKKKENLVRISLLTYLVKIYLFQEVLQLSPHVAQIVLLRKQ